MLYGATLGSLAYAIFVLVIWLRAINFSNVILWLYLPFKQNPAILRIEIRDSYIWEIYKILGNIIVLLNPYLTHFGLAFANK